MGQNEMRTIVRRMLDEARALRAAFPDPDVMETLPVSALPPRALGEDEEVTTFRAALIYLYEEMQFVRDGKAESLSVLDDEIAYAESLMPHH